MIGREIVKHVIPVLKKAIKEAKSKGLSLVVATASAYIQLIKPFITSNEVILLGAPVSGEISGVYELLNLPEFQNVAKNIAKVREVMLMEEIKKRVIRNEAIYGLNEIERILRDKRTRTAIFTKKTLSNLILEMPEVIEKILLNMRERNGRFLVVEDKDAIGVFINSIGGFVAF